METAMRQTKPLLSGFLGTAALAIVVGGLLLNHQGGHAAGPSEAQVAPASAAMMQVLRDEHGLVATMLSARLATEKQELAAGGANHATAAPRQPAVTR
jgi:hypothetical protein